jgi:hypothetical protein
MKGMSIRNGYYVLAQQLMAQFQSALAQIGDSWQISEDLFLQMRLYLLVVCR